MFDFDIKILGSSSRGNCYILRTSNESLILEAGIPFKEIQKGLDFNLADVVGTLVSHEHLDHSKSITELTKRGIKVYSAQETFTTLGIKSHNAKPIEALKKFSIGGFSILPFDVQHDAVNPLGFLITHKSFGKLLFATDTFYIKYKFKGLNYLMIECNYSLDIVNKKHDEGKINTSVLKRLLHSHLSLENLKGFLKANDLSKLKEIHLLHLSDENSDSKLFKKEIQELTGIMTNVC